MNCEKFMDGRSPSEELPGEALKIKVYVYLRKNVL